MKNSEKSEVTGPGISEQYSVWQPGRETQSHWDSFLHSAPLHGQIVLLQVLAIGVWEMGPWSLLSV